MYFEMTRRKLGLIFLASLMILTGVWLLYRSTAGLVIHSGVAEGRPFQLIRPQETNAKRPLVMLAHGLAGSGTIMKSLAFKVAHGGYDVLVWDFDGHGHNPYPMEEDIYSPWLLTNVELVLKAASDHSSLDTSRIAIAGHSMGTAAALTFGQIYPATRATVAISPVGTRVTPVLPQNLLLLAGEFEPDFVKNAQSRLMEAGGVGGDTRAGSARDLHIIPSVEHISIIFSAKTHDHVLDWLDQTFGPQAGHQNYTDRRLLWYALVLVGTLTLATSVLPPNTAFAKTKRVRLRQGGLIMLISSLCATLILWVPESLGISLNTIFGIRAGGYLILWFLVSGSIGLLILKPEMTLPAKDEAIIGLLIFVALWLGIGLAGDTVWLPWMLIPKRLLLWPLVIVALAPWTWLAGLSIADAGVGKRLLLWFLQSSILLGALSLTIKLSPSLGFLSLLLPIFPVVLLFLVLPNLKQRGSWSYAISSALFVSWMLLAVFPLI